MQLTIEHRTRYAFGKPVNYTIQELRMTPQDGFGQRVTRWEIRVNGAISPHSDAFGNAAHTLVVDRPHDEINITAIGEVETGLDLPPQKDALPMAVFLRATPLTLAHEALTDFAGLFRAKNGRMSEATLTALMHAICKRVQLRQDDVAPRISALQAFVAGAGSSRDHAHIFIACCRKLGVPARFVSGYRFTSDGSSMVNHAWADAWLEGKGWLSFDVTHGERANGIHVRLATGLDDRDACPVNGVQYGDEQLMSCSVSAYSTNQSQQ
jgi:transglutaminase-like putative cysteine protease